jgi:transcription elongation GreA/GreB family factor
MCPRIGIGSRFFIREESTRTERIIVLGESPLKNSEAVDISSPLVEVFLGRGINDRIAAEIQDLKGRWEVLSIV